MVCTSESVDCLTGFGAIEILIVSVIVLSFVGIALTILCCLCRQYGGDNSAEDSCHFQDFENELGHVGSKAPLKYGIGDYFVGGGRVLCGSGDGIGRETMAGPKSLVRKGWEDSGEECGNFDSVSSACRPAIETGADDDPAGSWIRFGDRTVGASKCSLEKFASSTPTETAITSLPISESEETSFHSSLPRPPSKYSASERPGDGEFTVYSIEMSTSTMPTAVKPLSPSCLRHGCYRQQQRSPHRSMEMVSTKRPDSLNLSGSRRSLGDLGVLAGGKRNDRREVRGGRPYSRREDSSRRNHQRGNSGEIASLSAPVTPADTPKEPRGATPPFSGLESRDVTPFESQDEESLPGFMEPLQIVGVVATASPVVPKSKTNLAHGESLSHPPLRRSHSENRCPKVNEQQGIRAKGSRRRPEENGGADGRLPKANSDRRQPVDCSNRTSMRKSGSFPSPLTTKRSYRRVQQQRPRQEPQKAIFSKADANLSSPPAPRRRSRTISPPPPDHQPPSPPRHLPPPLALAARAQGPPRLQRQSIPSRSKIMTTFTAGDEDEDEKENFVDFVERRLNLGSSAVARDYGTQIAQRVPPIQVKESKMAGKSGINMGRVSKKEIIEVTESMSNESVKNPFILDDTLGNLEPFESNLEELACDDINAIDTKDNLRPPESSPPSLIGARKEARSDVEYGDSDGRRREYGAKYDRFDTGFWEDDSSFGPDIGGNNATLLNLKAGNDDTNLKRAWEVPI